MTTSGAKNQVGGSVIHSMISAVVNAVKKTKSNCPPPSDCFVLRVHYNYGFWLFGFLFWVTFYQWYSANPLSCVSHFDAERSIRIDYLNFCLSYMFVASDEGANMRRYLFFYRWLHWLMFVVAILFYSIRKFAKSFETVKLRKMFTAAHQTSDNYRTEAEQQTLERIVRYLIGHIGSHNPAYVNAFLSVLLSFIIDVLVFWFIDYLLHNRFFSYGLYALTTTRDTDNYSDYISKTFPPFAKCHLEPRHEIVSRRAEMFGCHLGFMEVYEKLFFFVWVYLVIVITLSLGYLIYLALHRHPYFQKISLRPKSPFITRGCKDVDEKIMKVLKHCKTGDIFVLLKLKKYLSDTRFYMLICRLSEPTLAEIVTPKETQQPPAMEPEKALPKQKSGNSRPSLRNQAVMLNNPDVQAVMVQMQNQRGMQ